MRQIKFRAWNTVSKTMIDLEKITPLALDPSGEFKGLFIPFDDRISLMQFTGLLDKNGKEIYEGDILRCDQDGYPLFEVIWLEDRWSLRCRIGEFKGVRSFQEDVFEVIGNIYENSDLLK